MLHNRSPSDWDSWIPNSDFPCNKSNTILPYGGTPHYVTFNWNNYCSILVIIIFTWFGVYVVHFFFAPAMIAPQKQQRGVAEAASDGAKKKRLPIFTPFIALQRARDKRRASSPNASRARTSSAPCDNRSWRRLSSDDDNLAVSAAGWNERGSSPT